MIKTVIFYLYLCIFVYVFSRFNKVTHEDLYKELYFEYKNKYNTKIEIKEIKGLRSPGFFYYVVKKGEICDYPENILINKTTYKKMLNILIHELTHYLQCLYSKQKNKIMGAITNNKPLNKTKQFIENLYSQKFWNMEYEAFYYQDNIDKFNKLEQLVI